MGELKGAVGEGQNNSKTRIQEYFFIIILFEVYMQIFNGFMWCTFHLMRVAKITIVINMKVIFHFIYFSRELEG